MEEAYSNISKSNEALNSSLEAREALMEHIADRLQLKGCTNGLNIICGFSVMVAENLVPIAEMQSQLAHIMDMADDDGLRVRFAGFLNAPVDSDSQKKNAALYEIRDALLLPREDDTSVMMKWVHAMHAASIQWSRDEPQKWEEYSTKLSHHMTRGEHKAENRRALEAMAEEGKVKDCLYAYFAALERDHRPDMETGGSQSAV